MACGSTDPRPGLAQPVVDVLVANHRRFLAFLERRVGSRAIAEDILHDAFVRSVERGGELRREESAIAWFYRALRNAVVDYHRRNSAAGRGLDRFAAELDVQSSTDDELAGEVCRCVGQLADTLKPEYATALRRIEIDGVTVKEFAAETGLSTGNAAVRVFRARRALKEQVARACGTCAEHGCLDCHCGRAPVA